MLAMEACAVRHRTQSLTWAPLATLIAITFPVSRDWRTFALPAGCYGTLNIVHRWVPLSSRSMKMARLIRNVMPAEID
jgi:hypothetical protein